MNILMCTRTLNTKRLSPIETEYSYSLLKFLIISKEMNISLQIVILTEVLMMEARPLKKRCKEDRDFMVSKK